MKLYEVDLPLKTTVSIGSQSGAGYFYIGSLGEFWYKANRGFFEKRFMEVLENDLRRKRIAVKNNLKEVRERPKSLVAQERLANSRKKYRRALNRYVRYVEVSEREVLEIYERMCESGYAILVEGDESGRLWDASECINPHNGKSS